MENELYRFIDVIKAIGIIREVIWELETVVYPT
jgi:hypothetical protein